MNFRFGPFEIDAHAARADGAHINVLVERSPHPEWGFRRQRCVFAAWWARRCDAGVSVLGAEKRWTL